MSLKRFREKIKKHFHDILEIKTTPYEIALGFAIGTFFANFPTFGFEFLLIFLILLTFKRLSKISLLLAYAIFNPLIAYPISAVSYMIGDFILVQTPVTTIKLTLYQEVIKFTIRFLLGSFIVATILALIGFVIVYYLSKKYQLKEIPILQKSVLE